MLAILKRYFTLINLVILSAGIFIIAHIISFNIGKIIEPPLSVKGLKGTTSAEKEAPLSFEAYNNILERNIFNSKRLTVDATLPVPEGLNHLKEERPSIPLKLIGTVAGAPSYAYAIIETSQKGESIFRVDDTIAPGIKLVEIDRNMIVITRDGVREEIQVASEGWFQAMARQIKQSVVELFSPEDAPPVPSPSNRRDYTGPAGTAPGTTSSKDISIPLSEGMNSLLTQAKLVPYMSGGESDGFMINSIEEGSLYDKVGLQDGDIIAEINGLDLRDPREALDLYQTLKDQDFFVIEFSREGNKMTLTSLNSDVLALLISIYRTGY